MPTIIYSLGLGPVSYFIAQIYPPSQVYCSTCKRHCFCLFRSSVRLLSMTCCRSCPDDAGGGRGGSLESTPTRRAVGQLTRGHQPTYADSNWWLGAHSIHMRESPGASQVEQAGTGEASKTDRWGEMENDKRIREMESPSLWDFHLATPATPAKFPVWSSRN